MSARIMAPLLGAALAVAIAAPGNAASITVETNAGIDTIYLIGEMTVADIEVFGKAAASSYRRWVDTKVVLNSPGGSALAGIRIGEIIRQKRFSTWVLSNGLCVSSCALAWLGGYSHLAEGKVGFHGVFDATTRQQSGPGNALVGAYLNRLGLSDLAIAYITMTDADGVQWLTAEDARAIGIDNVPAWAAPGARR